MEIKLPGRESPVLLSLPDDAMKDLYIKTWQELAGFATASNRMPATVSTAVPGHR